ncbi:MAG: hypothetical protein ACC661_05075 [Verrucomicrobiales bacterium]
MAIPAIHRGAEVGCPHCHTRIQAPSPEQGIPAGVLDPQVLEVVRFQREHARDLKILRRGALASSLERKLDRTLPFRSAEPLSPVPRNPAIPVIPAMDAPAADPPRIRGPVQRLGLPALHPRIQGAGALWNQEQSLPWEFTNASLLQENRPAERSSWGLVTGAVAVTALLALLVLQLARDDLNFFALGLSESSPGAVAPSSSSSSSAKSFVQTAALSPPELRTQEAVATARSTLEMEDWRALLPWVRDPHRVAPLMADYYRERTWNPIHFRTPGNFEYHDLSGRRFLSFDALDSSNQRIVIGLEETSLGWKVDWEVLVPLEKIQWKSLLEDRPREAHTLRASIIRRTPTEAMIRASGIPVKRAFGVMLWGSDITEGSVYAVLERDSETANDLAEFASFERGVRVIAALSFPAADQQAPTKLVNLERIVARGWTIVESSPLSSPTNGASTIALGDRDPP